MVTKRQAVQALIRGALRAVQEGDEVCALTLAGAAEEAMPKASRLTVYDVMKMNSRFFRPTMTDREAAAILNAERNWLKHNNSEEASEMDIYSGSLMILRAFSRYMVVYGFDDLTREYGEYMGWPPSRE